MKVSEVKQAMIELAQLYFTGASVGLSKQSFIAKANKPFVKLSTGSVSRSINPPTRILDGCPVAFYPATIAIQVDLFTNGKQTEVAPGFTPVIENTAEDDLIGFADFLNSGFVVEWCRERDIAIIVPNTVNDLTGLITDTNYEFRAMLELMVCFTMEAVGHTAILAPESVIVTVEPVVPEEGSPDEPEYIETVVVEPVINISPSGGGNEELVASEGGYFSNVEINDKLVKEESST